MYIIRKKKKKKKKNYKKINEFTIEDNKKLNV